MAVGNSLTKRRGEANAKQQMAVYEVDGQTIELTPEIVKEYMISGDKSRVSMQEIIMFMNLCKYSGLNPWAKEAYCIKYGNEPATMVVGKEAYMKRAESNAEYDGFEAGIIVFNPKTEEILHRSGSFKLKEEEIIGGYAKVWRKDRSHPYVSEVSFEEYVARKKDGSLNSQWSKRPATMVRKVALVQALREAFPSAFGGMYSEEESEFVAEVGTENGDSFSIPIEETQAIEHHESIPNVMSQEVVNQEDAAPEGQQSFF